MRRNWIGRCLQSLQASTVPVIPIVIDNGSTDETSTFVPQRFPNAVWLPQGKNLGFGQANNVGLRYAMEHQANYVLLLNQDATIGQDAIEKMLPLCDDDTAVSPLHLNGDGTRLDGSFKQCLLAGDDLLLDDLLVSHRLLPAYSGPTSASKCVIPAACWFLPITIIKNIGGFNPLFFHYGEDVNYYQRLCFHHKTIRICPHATMNHDRNEHGNMQMFYQKRTRLLLLIVSTDIGATPVRRIWEWVQILRNCYFKELRSHRYHPGEYIAATFWMTRNVYRIRHSRKVEKGVGPTWLE